CTLAFRGWAGSTLPRRSRSFTVDSRSARRPRQFLNPSVDVFHPDGFGCMAEDDSGARMVAAAGAAGLPVHGEEKVCLRREAGDVEHDGRVFIGYGHGHGHVDLGDAGF